MDILVISDSHITPACPNVEDWARLGEYVVKKKPAVIVHLGDVADLASLAWLKNARGPYTTEEEMSAVSEHLMAFEDVLLAEQMKNRRDKKAIYRPHKILCLGNHDVRNGFTGIEELFEDCGWFVSPYLEPVEAYGINFCHCLMKGLSDNPCVTAEELLQNWHGNVVVGHGHKQDYSESYSMATHERIHAIKCPVFNSDDTGWAVQTRNKWARGFTEIRVNPFEFVWRDMKCLQEIC